MKNILILLALFVGRINAQEPNKYEERISQILEILEDKYYFQSIPEDLMGRVPPAGYENKYPFRVALRKFQKELNELLDKTISEAFFIALLDDKNSGKINIYKAIEKLKSFETDAAYSALYEYFLNTNIKDVKTQIGTSLVANRKYKREIKSHVLENPDINTIDKYLRLLDLRADSAILEIIAEYMYANLEKNPFASFLKVGIFAQYYGENFDENISDYIGNMGSGERFERAREKYWRQCSQNALNAHKRRKKESRLDAFYF